jgi:hypothetical protein
VALQTKAGESGRRDGMSRYYGEDNWDDEYSQARANIWEATTRRAIRGKRGQANLRFLLEALEDIERAVPEFPEWMPGPDAPRLIEGAICKNGEVCAVGAFARKKRGTQWLLDVNPDEDELSGQNGLQVTAEIGSIAGLQITIGYLLAELNDDPSYGWWHKETPEQRFVRVKRAVQGMLQPNEAGTAGTEPR